MKYCPYAQRARLVLAAKNIPYETVNIHLSKKPKWYTDLNPLGAVPCLHIDQNKSIPESLVVSEYLEAKYPDPKLQPSDPFTNAQHKLIVDFFANKVITNFYKFLRDKDQAEAGKALTEGLQLAVENKLNSNFFGGIENTFLSSNLGFLTSDFNR
jgi:glutathione S-transferase